MWTNYVKLRKVHIYFNWYLKLYHLIVCNIDFLAPFVKHYETKENLIPMPDLPTFQSMICQNANLVEVCYVRRSFGLARILIPTYLPRPMKKLKNVIFVLSLAPLQLFIQQPCLHLWLLKEVSQLLNSIWKKHL